MPRLRYRELFDASGLTLTRVECDGVDAPRPAEERVERARVVVPLVGRFLFRDRSARAVASPAVALFLPDDASYEIAHPHGEGDVNVTVRGELATRLVEAGPVARPLGARGYVRLHTALAALATPSGAPPDRLELEEEICLALAPEPNGPERSVARDRERAAAIAHEVELRFDEPLPLAELASRAGVSLFEACRVFRRARGTTIHAHQRRMRLRHALALVLETRMPLAEVAVTAGFANQGHFGNLFRAEFGVAPGRVRKPGGLRALTGS